MVNKKAETKILMVLLLTIFIFACKCSFFSKIGEKPDTSAILAEWDNGKITENEFEKRLESIPDSYKPKEGFNVERKQQILENYGIEEIFYIEAKEKEFDKNQNVLDYYDKYSINTILNQYNTKEIKDKIKPTESNLKKYYEENKDEFFTQKPTATIMHIQTPTADSAEIALSELRSGVDFQEVVEKYSNNDYTKKKDGKLTSVKKDSYISTIGKSPEIDSLIFSTKLNVICEPIKFKDNYHIIKVTERDMGKYKPFDEAKNDVEKRYQSEKENLLKNNLTKNLTKKYQVTLDTTAIKNINFQKADTVETEANIQLIISQVEEIAFTVGDFAKELKEMPEPRKQSLDSYEGRKQFLEYKLNNDIMYYDAIKKGYEKNPEIEDELARIKMIAALREYYKAYVVDSAIVTQEEIREVYDNEKDKKYSVRASSTIQQFVFPDRETADYVLFKAKNAESDEELNELINEYASYKTKNGILGPIYESGSISGLGKDTLYVQKIFETEVGDFSDIFQNMKNDYVFFKVISYTPKSYRDYDKISPEIERKLSAKKQEDRFESLKDIIIAKYNLKLYPERLEKKHPVDSLYKFAENAMSQKQYKSAIDFYDQIIKYYNNGKDDYKAIFMKGFIYSENLNDKKKAEEMFTKVLTFPEGELHASADYMLQALIGENDILDKINKISEEEKQQTDK